MSWGRAESAIFRIELLENVLDGAVYQGSIKILQGIALKNLDRSLVDGAVKDILEQLDPEYGGFRPPPRHFRGTKFPMPPYLELLLHKVPPRDRKNGV